MALQAGLEDKKNDLDAMAKLYGVYKDEVGDRREAEKLKLSMEAMMLDIKKTQQEIDFNNASMPYKIEQMKNQGNTSSRNPLTGEMEFFTASGEKINADIPRQTQDILSQPE